MIFHEIWLNVHESQFIKNISTYIYIYIYSSNDFFSSKLSILFFWNFWWENTLFLYQKFNRENIFLSTDFVLFYQNFQFFWKIWSEMRHFLSTKAWNIYIYDPRQLGSLGRDRGHPPLWFFYGVVFCQRVFSARSEYLITIY